MKYRHFFKFILAMGFLFGSACDSNKDNSRPATTPLNNACLNQVCDGSVYNQAGWMPYPTSYAQYGGYNAYYNQFYYGNYSYNYYGQFCDCPSGYLPAYNSDNGLGCVQTSAVQPYWSFAAYFSLQANNNWTNVPIMSSVQGPSTASSRNCYNSVLTSCLADMHESCGRGYACQTTSGASRIGICVRR